MDENNILALDVGKKRIGVSLANLVTRIPQPLITLAVDGDEMVGIKKLIDENNAETVVVGLPRGLEGQETAQTEYARKFGSKLQELGVSVHYQDEALTSVKAKEELEGRKKPYQKHEVDSLAATYILEDYLREHYE